MHVLDDDPRVANSIRELVATAGLVSSEYANATEFESHFVPVGDCCVILDLRLPDANGMDVLWRMHRRHPTIPVIVISAYATVRIALQASEAGAIDVFEKPFAPVALLESIQRGCEVCHERREEASRHSQFQELLRHLTARERQVMSRLCLGLTVKEIAFEFDLSPKTVQIHQARVLRRMRVRSVVQLVNLVHECEEASGLSRSDS